MTAPEKIPAWHLSAAIVAILVIYIALRLPGIGIPLDRDEGAFGHMGQLIDHGGLPYRDGLDHKPPVAFYINALALRLVPASAPGVHTFLLVYNFLTLVCLFFLAKVFFRSTASGLWCAFSFAVFSASPDIQGFTASTEMWALLPISASLLAAVIGVRRRSAAWLLASGAAGAIACWTKQTMASSILFVALYAAFAPLGELRPFTRAKLAGAARNAAIWTGGAALVSGAIVLYFYAHGLIREFVYWCFTYGFSYANQVSMADSAEDFRSEVFAIAASSAVILIAGIGVAVWEAAAALRAHKPAETWPAFVLAFLAMSFLGTLPGYAYSHYFAQLAPALAIAAGQGFRFLTARRGAPAAIVCAAAALATPLLVNRDYFFERDPERISRNIFEDNPFPESKPVADFIAARTTPSDLVFIEGSEPQILFYANRRSPTPFLMIYPLLANHPRNQVFQQQMIADLQARPPKYIVSMLNIPESFAEDEAVEPKILKFVDAFLARDYVLERSRLVGGRDGEWIEPGSKPPDADAPVISIYRRKGSI